MVVCDRLSECTKRLSSASADVTLLKDEREEQQKKLHETSQAVDRLEHDCEMHKNMSIELRAELAAARAAQEKIEKGMDDIEFYRRCSTVM